MQSDLFKISLLFWASLFLFIIGQSSQEIIGFDSRFYLFALEMGREGIGLFPTTYGQPYPDYPVLSTLLINFSAYLLGGLNKFTAILPSAIAASLTVVMTYLIGALRNKYFGFYAALFLFLTIGFFKSARGIALDMYPTLITSICFYIIYSADILQKPKRVKYIYLFLILSFAFRGPIGLVIPQSVISMYYLLNKDIKKFFVTGIIAAIILSLCTGVLLLLAYYAGGSVFVQDVLRMEVMGRINDAYQPLYFYFSTGIGNYALSYPLAILVTLGIIFSYKNISEKNLILKLIAWALIILIGMSIPGDKKIRYILAASPAFALISAYLFIYSRGYYLNILYKISLLVFLLLPLLLCIGTGYISYYVKLHKLIFNINYFNIISSLLILQTIDFVLLAVLFKNQNVRNLCILSLAAFAFVMCMITVVEPIELTVDKTRDFVMTIEKQRKEAHAALVFYKEHPDGLPIKYMMNLPASLQPIFINNTEELDQIKMPVFVVTSVNYFKELPVSFLIKVKLIANDKMAHVPVVVFSYGK